MTEAALLARVERALAAHLGRPAITVDRATPLSGGDVNAVLRVETRGGEWLVKSNAALLPGLFTSEAAGLRALRASGTGLAVPEVVTAEDPAPGRPGLLLTAYLAPGPKARDHDEQLGRGLAALHRSTAATFGFERDTYCGATLQPNAPVATGRWVDFYAERRLGHLTALGARRGLWSGAALRTLEAVVSRLPERLAGPDELPALVHGDLWSGNVLATRDGPALIDPAAYHAHREAELGMMRLFGAFSPRVYAAYDEAWPLAPGWEARAELYELYHLMNHALLFGGGYVAQSIALARRHA